MLMLLRMIISALNPYGNKGKYAAPQYESKSIGFRLKNGLFSFSIKCMQRLYRRYAYNDSIELGSVKILQSCRDKEFERWLKIVGKDIKPHLELSKTDASVCEGLCSSMPFWGFFRFERQFVVMQNEKKIVVNHSPKPFVYSEIVGTFKKSCSSDIMIWTEFKASRKSLTESYSKIQEQSQTEDKQVPNHKVSIGKITSPHIESIVTDSPKSKMMRGVEIDESF